MRSYTDKNADISLIKNKKIAIIGYGSQAKSHAANLRDFGVKEIRIGLRATSKTRAAGFKVVTPVEAAKWADVVMLLTPDETQAEIYKTIAPHIKKGASLAFAHGFNVHFGFIKPRKDLDVWMIAPKDIGPMVRSEYEQGRGVAALLAVHQNATGKAKQIALAYGAAIGCGRAGMFETTFREECEVDLFGEQAVLFGGLPPLMTAAFETLVTAGYEPEMAYFKCVQQVKLVTDAICRVGIADLSDVISNTAEYGGTIAAPRLVTKKTKKEMKQLLADIQSGKFAKQWIREHKEGEPLLMLQRNIASKHPVEKAGRALRATPSNAAKTERKAKN